LDLFVALLAAEAQLPVKVPRIGVLSTGSPRVFSARFEPFIQGLRELGYVEGQTIAFAYRFADGQNERLPGLAAELIDLPVEVLVTSGTPAARALGVQLQAVEVQAPHEFTSAFAAMSSERASALMLLADSMFGSHRTQVVELAAKSRLPALFFVKDFVAAGGLVSYGASYSDLLRRVATYVDKILKGAKPADLPMEQPTTFELVINLKTAEALGLTIPPTLLFQATEVIR
jgi:ABC-type uncharacterized transport system substrate-binding protein